jgi:VWFA-related protein
MWAALLTLVMVASVTSQEPQIVDTIKIDTNLISVPVIVSDRDNRYVRDLKVDAFRLFDNQVEQKISFFDTGEEPLNVVLMLDTSLSTSGVLDDIRKAAKAFLKQLRPQDRAMVVTFDFQTQKLSTLTNDQNELASAVKHANVGKRAGTVLNDALTDVSTSVLQPIRGRKAIVLLSDGNDHGSLITTEELISAESEADAMIYSIYYQPEFFRFMGPPGFPGGRFPRGGPGMGRGRRRAGSFGMEGEEIMERLADVTGGRFYQGETKDLKDTFALIAEELRHQYRLGFYPADLKRDGAVHTLQVKVNVPDVSVRSRREYLAK